MSKIDTIIFNECPIPLNGKHLILTGRNGSGKTYFLNNLRNYFEIKKNNENSAAIDIDRNNLNNSLIELTEKYATALQLNPTDLETIIHFRNTQSNLVLEKILVNLEEKSYLFNKRKEDYFKKNSRLKSHEILIRNMQSFASDIYYHYHTAEHLENIIKKIKYYSEKILNNNKNIQVLTSNTSNPNYSECYFFDSSRVPSNEGIQLKIFQDYISLKKNYGQSKSPNLLEAYLIYIKKEIKDIFKQRLNDGHTIWTISHTQKWFLKVENDLKEILENDSIELSFSSDDNEVLINIKNLNRSYTFDQLSSGYKAIFYIYSALLMEAQNQEILPENLEGITIIDEIDVHLHISLQKKVLPFLIKAFPKIQFIVSTHSPFVITSTHNDTVVYDLSTGEFFEEDLSIYSHESIIKELFHVQDENENLVTLSNQLIAFIESETQLYDLDSIQILLNEVNKSFDKLSVELQLQYMIAKNKLAKLKHEGN